MPRLISFTISYYSYGHEFTVPELIDMYLQNGWTLHEDGKVSLRPLGDKDDIDWVFREMTVDQLYEIIRKKVEAGEDPAVGLRLKDTDVGMLTTFYPEKRKIDFLFFGGRRRINPELPEWTDVNWYLAQLCKPLLDQKIVTRVEFSEMV